MQVTGDIMPGIRSSARLLIAAVVLIVMGSASGWSANALEKVKHQFNKDKGVARLVLLVSPTCPACVGGAQYIQQEILAKYPDLPLKVYAVWYEMLPTDSVKAFPSAKQQMPDHRVEHFWDKKKVAGRWFKDAVPSSYDKPVQWDAYYLFDADAEWSDKPAPMVSWGRTLLESRHELEKQIGLLDAKRKQVASR
jgi:hypothetical protein